MSIWTCVLSWFRFTVPDSTTDRVMSRIGGEWIKDKKGFLGYHQGWLSRGNTGGLGRGGLGRIGTAAGWAPREVHVDLSQELISDWTYQKFHEVATWVFEQNGHFGRIDVALDDRNGVIDVDRIYAAVKAGNCVSHFRQSGLAFYVPPVWRGGIMCDRRRAAAVAVGSGLGAVYPLATIFGFVGLAVWYGGWGPALFTAVMSYLILNWLIIEPRHSFKLATSEQLGGLSLFVFSVSVLICVGHSMRRAQRHARLVRLLR